MEKINESPTALDELLKNADLKELVERMIEERKTEEKRSAPPDAWFLGPKAEHGDIWLETFKYIFRDYIHWRRNYFPEDPNVIDRERLKTHEPWLERMNSEIDKILNQLKAHFPFYSPRYNAHMLSEQTFPSVVGYFAGMLYNPNNVTEEAAPITLSLELEVGRMVAEMLGYNPNTSWAHICSGGTVANIEALWTARTIQFAPLVVRDYCERHGVKDFEIQMPDRTAANILDLNYRELVGLKPSRTVYLVRHLARHLSERIEPAEALESINSFFPKSRFNINNAGVYPVLKEIGIEPVIFASEAAHYSIKKAANVLGYGEGCVEFVPVDAHFRLDARLLEEKLSDLPVNKYAVAVVAIAGTTEEGAVDPIHKMKFFRDKLEREQNRSFWLHVDAAWGGYIRSLFRGHDFAESHEHRSLAEICEDYFEKMDVTGEAEVIALSPVPGVKTRERKKVSLEWRDREVYSAFLAMPDADSITIDPHKLGYIPYPAGIVAFQKSLVTEFVVQRAQYISDETGGVRSIEKQVQVQSVGPYILEGSKPGAAAAACWLSHKTIPLVADGHGKLIRSSLLNAKKFARYIGMHKKVFETIELKLYGKTGRCKRKFGFELLHEPDTNIVCFLCVPMIEDAQGNLRRDHASKLADINNLNRQIYEHSTLTSTQKKRQMPYSQEFFVSRTILAADQYKPVSVQGLLDRFDITIHEYEQHGVFVLRSTIMNPWHDLAQEQGKNYLYDFLMNLHQIAREALNGPAPASD